MLKIEVNESSFLTFHAEGTALTLMAEMIRCVDKLIREIGKGAAEAGADAGEIMANLYNSVTLCMIGLAMKGGVENDSSQLSS